MGSGLASISVRNSSSEWGNRSGDPSFSTAALRSRCPSQRSTMAMRVSTLAGVAGLAMKSLTPAPTAASRSWSSTTASTGVCPRGPASLSDCVSFSGSSTLDQSSTAMATGPFATVRSACSASRT